MPPYELRCRECGKSWGNQPRSICDDCFSPLEVSYDYDALRATVTRERIAQGPPSMWRYSDLLPLARGLQTHFAGGIHATAMRAKTVRSNLGRRTSI